MVKSTRGSMVPASSIISDIESKRLDPLAEASKSSTTSSEVSSERKEVLSEVESSLPETVLCAFGELSYDQFSETFKEVYEQVRDKDHLISGHIEYRGTLSGVPVVLHNLRAGERRALIPLMADPRTEDIAQYSQDDITYRLYVLVVSLQTLGDFTFDSVPKLKVGSLDSWRLDPLVTQAVETLEDIDETLLTTLYQLFIDISNAKQFALIDNLKNR